MRKFLFVILFIVPFGLFAQYQQSSNDSLYKPIIPIEKQNLLKNVDLIMNMRFGFDNNFLEGTHTNSQFNNNQVRLEIKGKIHDKIFFRFRDRYTKDPTPGSRDNISRATDMAYIGVDLSPKAQLTFGKMSADWGGYEFDLNPIDILMYNDILDAADNFLTGVGASYQLFDNHKFGVQILNSRTQNLEDTYGDKIPEGIEKSKIPVAFVGSWRGSFFDGKFETIYSYSYFQEAKNKGMNYVALGNKFHSNGLSIMYDFKYSHEALDRKGIVTGFLANQGEFAAQNVSYMENWLRVEYLISKKINVLLTVMNSEAYGKNVTSNDSGNNHLRTSYGYIPSIEYMPFKDLNMKFYISYVGRNYSYSDYSKEKLGLSNYDTGVLSVGFIAPLLLF